MTYLSDTFDEGTSLLGQPTPAAIETDAVKQDTFDHRVYRDLLDEAPALASLVWDDLGRKYDYTEELVGDVLQGFWQSDPILRPVREMHPRFLLNRAVAEDMTTAPETLHTRTFTRHDRYGSAMATIAVTEQIKESLEKAKEAKEAADAAAAAEEEFQQALQELLAAMMAMPGEGEASGLAGGGGMEGPLTEEQQEMFDALVKAIEDLKVCQVTYTETLEDAQDEARKVQAAMRQPIREAIEQVGDMLADEQELFSSWGVEDGELQKMSFDERQKLARALRANRLNEFRKLIGRFRMMAGAQRAKKVQYARDEVYNVEMSDRLPDVLSSEFGKLGNKHTRLEFLQALSEGQLLSKAYQGTEQVGQGAIIALVDNSGSMSSPAGGAARDSAGLTREAWAKAFALALLDQARAAKRDFVGINFSSRHQVSVFRFPKGEGKITDVLRFVEEFFGGGTDFEVPIDQAVDILEKEFNTLGLQRGDLVFITDDDCRVSPEWMRRYQERKDKLGFRTFGIAVGIGAGNALAALSDNVRSVTEFADPMAVADIIRTV